MKVSELFGQTNLVESTTADSSFLDDYIPSPALSASSFEEGIRTVFAKVRPDVSEADIREESKIFDALRPTFKVVETRFRFADGEDKKSAVIYVHLNSPFVNGLASIHILPGADFFCELECHVKSKFMVEQHERTDGYFDLLCKTWVSADGLLGSKIQDGLRRMKQVCDNFANWYVELTGEYGPCKMIRTTQNLVEGYSRGGEYRFVAIAGDFYSPSDLTNSDSPATRIF